MEALTPELQRLLARAKTAASVDEVFAAPPPAPAP
jgi:hypothetical protein